jgi:hypothetical protein
LHGRENTALCSDICADLLQAFRVREVDQTACFAMAKNMLYYFSTVSTIKMPDCLVVTSYILPINTLHVRDIIDLLTELPTLILPLLPILTIEKFRCKTQPVSRICALLQDDADFESGRFEELGGMQSFGDEHVSGAAVVVGRSGGGEGDGGTAGEGHGCRACSGCRETRGKVSYWYCFRLLLSESRKRIRPFFIQQRIVASDTQVCIRPSSSLDLPHSIKQRDLG